MSLDLNVHMSPSLLKPSNIYTCLADREDIRDPSTSASLQWLVIAFIPEGPPVEGEGSHLLVIGLPHPVGSLGGEEHTPPRSRSCQCLKVTKGDKGDSHTCESL